MESRDLVSVSRRVSRPVFWSLGLEGLRSCLRLEGFRSRSRALRPEIELFVPSSMCETIPLQVAYTWVAELFSKWGRTSAHQKN